MNIEIKESHNLKTDGIDVDIKNKIRLLSIKLFYMGFERIKVGDISTAISYLINAVKLDKTNYKAHNLLGLAYYRVGEISLAIRHWVISQNIKSGDNAAIKYLEQVRDNKAKLNDYNESFKKYNQSLHHAKAGSADLSIVNLKKAISINPNYVIARTLLALCYLSENKKSYAIREFKNVLKIDSGNALAKIQLSKLLVDDGAKKDFNKTARKPASAPLKPVRTAKISPINRFAYILSGIVLGAIIVYFALVPAIKQDLNSQIEAKDVAIEKLKEKVEVLNADLDKNKKSLDIADADIKEKSALLSASKARVVETEKLINVLRNYYVEPVDLVKAGNILVNIEEDNLSPELNEFTISMKADVLPVLADRMYGKGYNAYTRGAYDEAIDLFDLAYLFAQAPYPAENALYYKGRTYLKKGDTVKAAEAFNKLIQDYPESTLVPDAKYFLEQE